MKENRGNVTLYNSKTYPFNNSEQTVLLTRPEKSVDYKVLTKTKQSDGETGEIIVYGKARNGFKICFTGSAKRVIAEWEVV